MSASEDRPFFDKEAACPVCKKSTVHQYLRDYAYTVEKRDEDLFVSRYHWAKPEFEDYNLQFFHLWYCPHCHYTDERKMFITNKPEAFKNGFVDLKNALLKGIGSEPLVQAILKHIQYPAETFTAQYLLHVLAVYEQFLAPDYARNYEKIGKLYLRISWLFRMATAQDKSDEAVEKDIEAYFDLYQKLQANLMNSLHNLETLNQWIENKIETDTGNGYRFWKKHAREFKQNYEWFVGLWDTALPLLQNYDNLGKTIQMEYHSTHKNPFESPFQEYESFQKFIEELKTIWKGVPASESEAQKLAAHYLFEAIKSGVYDTKVSRYYSIMRLIVHLYQRLQQYSQALDKSRILIERLEYFDRTLEDRIKKATSLNEGTATVDRLNKNRMKVREMIRDAREQRAYVLRLKTEADEKRALEIFHSHRDCTPEELAELMRQQSIEEAVIKKYTAELESEKKKGLFQIFKF